MKFDVEADVIAQVKASRFEPTENFWSIKAAG
jgi:hypothetical protein